jgi:hypothetical protein
LEDDDSYRKNTKTMERRQQLLEEGYSYWRKANSYRKAIATGRRQQLLEGNSYWKKAKATEEGNSFWKE